MPLSEELLDIARAAASRLDLSPDLRFAPTFALAEEVCGDEFEQMLQLLHEDEVFAPVDLERQERDVDAIKAALTEEQQELVDDLVDNQSTARLAAAGSGVPPRAGGGPPAGGTGPRGTPATLTIRSFPP